MAFKPQPFTFDEFYGTLSRTCQRAWEDGLRQVTEVLLPFDVFPGVKSFTNPITGDQIPVRRIGMFLISERLVHEDHSHA